MPRTDLSRSLVVVLDDYRKRMSTPIVMSKTLVVVLEDYRRKKLPPPLPKNKKEKGKRTRREPNELNRDYYQRNRERIQAQRKEYRQRNLKKCRAQDRASSQRYWQNSQGAERQKEYRRKNCDALNERRREHRRKHRDAINRAEREYRLNHRDAFNERRRERYRREKLLAARSEVPMTSCDCGLCLVCGGFETESRGHGVTIPRSDPVEALERLLDRMDASTVCSDTSFEVDPPLEEELERLLNEASSDERDS